MGIVYEALDRERGIHVALKTLQRVDGAALYRFKQEFRAVAEVVHPNLVTLYELFADAEQPFFTMELVEGDDLVTHVRGPRPLAFEATSVHEMAPEDAPTAPGPSGVGAMEMGRLVRSMRQLAEAVAALHAHGKIHRDLKPSNVLVTSEGRVVVLDFGIVLDSTRQGRWRARGSRSWGRPNTWPPSRP